MAASPQSGNLKAAAGPPGAGARTNAVTGAGKWLITLSVLLGTFMSVMDVSVVNVAMPHMMGSFGQDLLSITWVSTAYSIAEIIMITMSGWWSTLLGRKRFFLGSMVLFTIGSIMAGSSHTFAQIVISRAIQGIGGGGLIPVSQAIARETFPPAEQGMAMALFNMGVVVAPTVGPTLGGWLVDNWGWQWVFFINLPICVLAVTMVSTFVHDPPYLKRGVARIDWGGIAALTVGLTSLQVVLERGQEMDWFASNLIFAGTIIAMVSLAALVVWELNIREPVIHFRLLRNVPLAVGSIIAACVSFMLFGSTFVIPQWVQTLMGYPAYQAGMLMLPRALTMLIVLPLVGRLYNYSSPPLLVAAGMAALAWSSWQMTHFPMQVSWDNFILPNILAGAGMACPMLALSTVSLSTIDRTQMTGAASIYTLSRRVAGNIAYALLATVVQRREQFHRTMLVGNLTPTSPIFRNSGRAAADMLQSLGPARSARSSVALINSMVNREATAMAFEDTFWLMVIVTVAALPLLLLLPRARVARAGAPAEEH
ncbi:MAG: DHA2 family efflux MFS transporter permease subunit [Candidatus Binataceae bacterium]